MTARRLDIGPLLALAGAALLLVSLFLDWYAAGGTGWEVFEVLDLVLAGVAVAALLAGFGAISGGVPGPGDEWLPWLAGGAFVIVAATLLNRPPAAPEGDVGVGLWLALAGAAAMAAGALMSTASISISVDVEGRRKRVTAVDARETEPAAEPPLGGPTWATEPPGAAPPPEAAPERPKDKDDDTTAIMPPADEERS